MTAVVRRPAVLNAARSTDVHPGGRPCDGAADLPRRLRGCDRYRTEPQHKRLFAFGAELVLRRLRCADNRWLLTGAHPDRPSWPVINDDRIWRWVAWVGPSPSRPPQYPHTCARPVRCTCPCSTSVRRSRPSSGFLFALPLPVRRHPLGDFRPLFRCLLPAPTLRRRLARCRLRDLRLLRGLGLPPSATPVGRRRSLRVGLPRRLWIAGSRAGASMV